MLVVAAAQTGRIQSCKPKPSVAIGTQSNPLCASAGGDGGNCTSCRLHVLHIGLSDRIGRIDEEGNHGARRDHLAQQLQPLWPQRAEEKGHARGVATRAVQAADKSELNWITAVREDDWSRR